MTNTVNNKIGNIDERYAKQGYDKLDQKGREVVHNLADETGGLDSKVCTDYLQRVNSGSLTPLPHQFDTAKFCIKNDLYEPLGYLQNEIGFNNVSDYLIYHASHANQPGYVKKFHQQYGLTKVTYEVGGKAATKEIAAYLMDNNILILPDYNGICDEEKTTLSDHPYNRHPIYNLFIQNDNELPSDYMYTEYFDYIKQNTDKDILKHIMQWTARTICKGDYIGIRSKRIRELFTSCFDQYWERKNYMRCLFYAGKNNYDKTASALLEYPNKIKDTAPEIAQDAIKEHAFNNNCTILNRLMDRLNKKEKIYLSKNVGQWWSKLLNRETPPGGTVRLLLKRVDPDLHKKQANKTKRILEQTTPSDTIKDIYTSKLAALGI